MAGSSARAGTTEAAVIAALARVADVDPAVLRADTPLADLRADALAVLQTADLVELLLARDPATVGLRFADAALLHAVTVGDLVNALEEVAVP